MARRLAGTVTIVHAGAMNSTRKSRDQRTPTRVITLPSLLGGGRIRDPRALLDWLCAGRADYAAFQRRKRTPEYRARKRLCKNIWIGAGLLMVLQPTLPIIGTLGLLATFLSFAILDESDGD